MMREITGGKKLYIWHGESKLQAFLVDFGLLLQAGNGRCRAKIIATIGADDDVPSAIPRNDTL